MQTGIFYVKLNPKLMEAFEQGELEDEEKKKMVKIIIESIKSTKFLVEDKGYPVLAIKDYTTTKTTKSPQTFTQGDVNIVMAMPKIGGWITFFLLPIENGCMVWMPSDLFVFDGMS